MPEWLDNFENTGVTVENKEGFTKYAERYATEGDAIVAGYNHQKMVGAPFKFPESLDKLPDDASRGEFTSQANKLLGIIKTGDINTLKDVNLKDGMAEGAVYNEDFANSFKQFAVDNSLNVSDMPKIAKFFNESMGKLAIDLKTKSENDAIAAAEACDVALIAHPDIGSKEKLLELTELFARAMTNNVGLSDDEVEELADGLALSKFTTNAVLSRVILKQFAPLAAEGNTEGGGPGSTVTDTGQTPYQWKQSRWPKSKDMWGKEDDKWEDQSIEVRKLAKRKE